ncbi:hypothetical protein NUW54_g12318 [Trametes sanguinea]|uniref:Uncharacterized protein n=1 Tax=Trametes sanguinea TaxID=158606 RepID=A0ACC1N150_9APHY|nr:hypothetical protein NUW54_g12318 [Trametes sanguinea]
MPVDKDVPPIPQPQKDMPSRPRIARKTVPSVPEHDSHPKEADAAPKNLDDAYADDATRPVDDALSVRTRASESDAQSVMGMAIGDESSAVSPSPLSPPTTTSPRAQPGSRRSFAHCTSSYKPRAPPTVAVTAIIDDERAIPKACDRDRESGHWQLSTVTMRPVQMRASTLLHLPSNHYRAA